MSKALPWILGAMLLMAAACIIVILWASVAIHNNASSSAERNALQHQADSLRAANVQLNDSVELHKLKAEQATAIADGLMKTDPQVIVDERVKLNRYATAEKVGEGLVKQLP